MYIQNNIIALNAYRHYMTASNRLARNVERLSSGYRINRAGDDPAGLAISEKMRAQIRGLNIAAKNCLDAISAVQTAEGALQSAHDILQRMRELALQSASDTNEQYIDRAALQQEFEQLQRELDDISGKTRFNDQNLLDGTFQKNSTSVNRASTTLDMKLLSVSVERAVADRYVVGIQMIPPVAATVIEGTGVAADTVASLPTNGKVTDISLDSSDGVATDIHNGNIYTLKITGSDLNNMTFQMIDTNGSVVSTARNVDVTKWNNPTSAAVEKSVFFEGIGTFMFTVGGETSFDDVSQIKIYTGTEFEMGFDANAGKKPIVSDGNVAMAAISIGGETVYVKKGDEYAHFAGAGITLRFNNGPLKDNDFIDETAFAAATGLKTATNDILSVTSSKGKGMVIQAGPNEGDVMTINIDSMDTGSLGIRHSNIATREAASRAITEVNNAINQISKQRASLGAVQNRLEFKLSYLETASENLQQAESRIRDVDIAKEMTEYIKNKILMETAMAMLAQANAIPQLVLQLFQF